MPLQKQPRIPFRHVVNHFLFKLRVGVQEHSKRALYDLVRQLLYDNMAPQAHKRFGPELGEDLAHQAAAKAIDDIRSGTMYLDSPAQERNLLTAAYRQNLQVKQHLRQQHDDVHHNQYGPRGEARHRQIESLWPLWKRVLLLILILSRRSWTYLWLYGMRDTGAGKLGRLTEIYLGKRGRQPSLTRDKNELDTVTAELDDASEPVLAGLVLADPIEELLRDLSVAERRCWTTNRSEPTTARLLAFVACSCLRPRRTDSRAYRHLNGALVDAANRFTAWSRREVAQAVEQLMEEAADPGSTWSSISRIRGLLSRIPPCHRAERDPSDVLDDIGSVAPPVKTEVYQPKALSSEDLRTCLGRHAFSVRAERPAFMIVFTPLLLCEPFNEIQRIIGQALHQDEQDQTLTAALRGCLPAAIEVFDWWEQLWTLYGKLKTSPQAAERNPPAEWLSYEMPDAIWQNSKALDRARRIIAAGGLPLRGPIDGPENRAIAAAVFDLLLDDLVTEMVTCHRSKAEA